MKKIIVALLLAGLCSCTANEMAKEYGGSTAVNLPCNRKLVNVMFDEKHDLWYLTKEMKAEDQAESYSLSEKSAWGILEGQIKISECRK